MIERMRCLIGDFHWDVVLDGECPNHGRNRSGPLSGPDGPTDREGIAFLGCCSVPVETALDDRRAAAQEEYRRVCDEGVEMLIERGDL